MVLELSGLTYEERREALDLPTLEEKEDKGIHGMTTLEFIGGHNDVNFKQFFEVGRDYRTRGITGSQVGKVWRDVIKHFFSNRDVDMWNKLSKELVNVSIIGKHKSLYDKMQG